MNSEFKRMQQLAGIKEITIGDPTKININNLEIGDKLSVKHVDEFIAFVFRVGQIWEIVNIDENREHYRLVNTNIQTSLGFSRKDIEQLIDSGTLVYAKESKVNEVIVRDPRIKEIVDNIILLDKKFIDVLSKMPSSTNQTVYSTIFYDVYENYGIIDALYLDYDDLREELTKQQYKALVELYEELNLVMDKLPKNINEMKVANPIFKFPDGWNEDKDIKQDPGLWDGEVINVWWAPLNGDDREHEDYIVLVKKDNQYYIHYAYAFSNPETEGPFSNKFEALKEVLEAMKETMSYWNEPDELMNEIKVKNPLSIANFCNQHFDEIQDMFGKIRSKFELTTTTGGIEVASAGTDEDDGIDISFDPEYLELADDYNDIEEFEIAGRGVYVNNYLNHNLDDEDEDEDEDDDEEDINEIKKAHNFNPGQWLIENKLTKQSKLTEIRKNLTTSEFIEKTKTQKRHQNSDGTPKYTYDKVNYIDSNTPVTITCPKHGDFRQTPKNHLKGSGCYSCAAENLGNDKRSTTSEFIEKAQKIHQTNRIPKYTYDKVNYVNAYTPVIVTCPKHGDWSTSPTNHLRGNGCPVCNESKGEKTIYNYLKEEYDYDVIPQKTYKDCNNKHKNFKTCMEYKFDFYLPQLNTIIEFDGKQHFKKNFFHKTDEDFNERVADDLYKVNYCKNKNIKLIRISYNEKDIIDQLNKGLKSKEKLWLSDNYPKEGWNK